MSVTVLAGDCLAVMPTLGPVDAIVCDPPYSLRFMGRSWDRALPPAEVWKLAFDLLPPGGMLVAFGGTRTHHRLWCDIEDAGFQLRDTVAWLFASGFPKSRALLKPAFEPICLARKPGPLRHLAIDACRVPATDNTTKDGRSAGERSRENYRTGTSGRPIPTDLGRWPANVVHDGSEEVLDAFARFGESKSSGGPSGRLGGNGIYDGFAQKPRANEGGLGDAGTAARFFFSGKAGPDDRCESSHPTVKPVSLMRWLCRLVCPAGGTVLDPFAGSGTTGVACVREGFNAILVEREAEYVADIRRRIDRLSGLDTPLFRTA